jgi:hypothetical protein
MDHPVGRGPFGLPLGTNSRRNRRFNHLDAGDPVVVRRSLPLPPLSDSGSRLQALFETPQRPYLAGQLPLTDRSGRFIQRFIPLPLLRRNDGHASPCQSPLTDGRLVAICRFSGSNRDPVNPGITRPSVAYQAAPEDSEAIRIKRPLVEIDRIDPCLGICMTEARRSTT